MRIARLSCLTGAVLAAAALAVPAVSAAPASAATPATSLTGAGSTLVAPLVAEWTQVFPAFYGINVQYAVSGSQAGLQQLASGAVDFAATDSPLTQSQRSACPRCGQIPWALTAVGIGYHVAGAGGRLRLTPAVLAQIYLGQITRWNDPRITALNPGITLPSLKITPIATKASGDTAVFTEYLSEASPAWRTRVGSGDAVGFPVGVTTTGNLGVTATLRSINGSIGYAGAAYLLTHRLPAAALRNAAGNYEYPNLSNVRAAASGVRHVAPDGSLPSLGVSRRAPNAYPLSTFSYVVVSTAADAAHRAALADWISFAVNGGQTFGQSLDFVPLPSAVAAADRRAVRRYAAG